MILLLLLTFTKHVIPHGDANGNGFVFIGNEHWSNSYIEQCNEPRIDSSIVPENLCYTFVVDLRPVNVEIFSRNPIIAVYRNFVDSRQIDVFMGDVHTKTLQVQQVVHENGEYAEHTSRRANGTWLDHMEMSGVGEIFRYTQRRLPFIDFKWSEQWQVLSYNSGGHYAPHYDYLSYETPEQHDWWMNNMGNRMATFLLVLKTASEGGGTVFPDIPLTVQPNPGDALFWTNMDGNGEMAYSSLHGACPILQGNKVAATIWIRSRGQELGFPTNTEGVFDHRLITEPKYKYFYRL